MNHRLFVYGSLRNPRVYESVTGERYPSHRAASAPDYRFSAPIHGYPAITSHPGSLVAGSLLEAVSDEALQRLDAYEEVGVDYIRRIASIEVDGEYLMAFVYTATDRERQHP